MFTFGEMAWMFLIYSMLGWIWETSYVSIRHKKLINRGFLRGPIIPIYGFAATTIMISLRLSDPYLTIEGWGCIGLIFVFSAIVATVWEYVTSAILEGLFKTRWWDYSKLKFNVKGRIAISVSVFWGVGSTILWLFVNKSIIAFYHRIPESIMKVELVGVYFLIFIDTVFTVMELFDFRKHVMKLQQTSDELVIKLSEKQINGFLIEVRDNIKLKVVYRKYEGFKPFSEFLDDMTRKGKEGPPDFEILRRRFKEDLSKLKGNVRFFKNYPDAKTKHFQMLFNSRKLDSSHEDTECGNGNKHIKTD